MEEIGSDHKPILVTVTYPTKKKTCRKPRWNFRKAKWTQYKTLTDQSLREIDMEGEMEDRSEISGIIPRSVYTLFEILMSTVKVGDWDITVSHLEIYQEELTDLLAPDELRNTLSARLASENITTSKALVAAAAKRGVHMKLDTRGTKRKALIAALD